MLVSFVMYIIISELDLCWQVVFGQGYSYNVDFVCPFCGVL